MGVIGRFFISPSAKAAADRADYARANAGKIRAGIEKELAIEERKLEDLRGQLAAAMRLTDKAPSNRIMRAMDLVHARTEILRGKLNS